MTKILRAKDKKNGGKDLAQLYLLEEANNKAREFLEVLLGGEFGVEEHHQVAGVSLCRARLHRYSTRVS